MGEVVKFEPVTIGDDYRFDPDEILEAAKGLPFDTVMVVGQLDDGELYIAGSANSGETLILLERAKFFIVHGE